ncbi:C40 family peptidase [Mycobacterium sp. AMU20-3851]|uniref:C40 family peptidase n=1 Tax=Mycobacterium sp. AMU20-3851 TaxID=3122055 RepID=UPI0037545D2F
MPGALTAALSAPLHRLLALLGPGHAAGPASSLTALQDRLDTVAQAAAGTAARLEGDWAGAGAAAAAERLERAVALAGELHGRIAALGQAAASAEMSVSDVRAALERLIADFEARAAALETRLDSPGTAEQLVEEARRAVAEALRLVEELRTELGAGARAVTASPAATSPMGMSAPSAGPGTGWTGRGDIPSLAGIPQITDAAFAAGRADLPDAAQFGIGEAVTLPDGNTATAPNAVAASAVRHALTQLGVPYQWGGTTAGVGLDCSGLTQWAYREAGLDIPRLAQEQDIGAAVSADALRPGDLAVWDGHVAMVVGDGLMVEAGDPVQLSAIRTTNAGQGFQGFWRPTA